MLNNIKKILPILLFALAAASCSDAGRDPEGALRVAVTVPPQAYFVEAVGGERVRVTSLMDDTADPETFEPTPSQRAALEDADVYFAAGHMPSEQKVLQTLRRGHPDLKVVDLSQGLALLYGTHAHGDGSPCPYQDGENHGHHHHHDHDHGAADPHTWTSVTNARVMAQTIARELAEADPAGKEYYASRLQAFTRGLDSLDMRLKGLLAPHQGETFVIWHPSLSYFAHDYGLHQLPLGGEGKEMSVKGLRRCIDAASVMHAQVFFYQAQQDARQVEAVNEALGASRTVSINPMGRDWPREMERAARAIANEPLR